VTCRDLDDVLSSCSGDSVHAPEAAMHIVGCERCRRLLRLLGEAGKVPGPSKGQLRLIETRIIGNLKPVRPLAPSWVSLLACTLIFLCVIAVGALRLGTNGWGALNMAQRAAVFATLAAGAVVLALSMVRQMAPGSKHSLAPAALPVAALAVLMLAIVSGFHWHEESAFVPDGLKCLRNGLKYSIPAAFLFWLLIRRGALLFPKSIGAAAGGLAGLTALSVLEVNCPNMNACHILVWHCSVVLIGSLAGALIGAAVEYVERSPAQTS
jgi:hypothetical protein